ncbi:hypothetical protein NMY22_g1543 [Coprinellus aureogranulatus]|nr:hypothetical protein NMY22_g1543 [Coprinellus aureogranulatus]
MQELGRVNCSIQAYQHLSTNKDSMVSRRCTGLKGEYTRYTPKEESPRSKEQKLSPTFQMLGMANRYPTSPSTRHPAAHHPHAALPVPCPLGVPSPSLPLRSPLPTQAVHAVVSILRPTQDPTRERSLSLLLIAGRAPTDLSATPGRRVVVVVPSAIVPGIFTEVERVTILGSPISIADSVHRSSGDTLATALLHFKRVRLIDLGPFPFGKARKTLSSSLPPSLWSSPEISSVPPHVVLGRLRSLLLSHNLLFYGLVLDISHYVPLLSQFASLRNVPSSRSTSPASSSTFSPLNPRHPYLPSSFLPMTVSPADMDFAAGRTPTPTSTVRKVPAHRGSTTAVPNESRSFFRTEDGIPSPSTAVP